MLEERDLRNFKRKLEVGEKRGSSSGRASQVDGGAFDCERRTRFGGSRGSGDGRGLRSVSREVRQRRP